MLFGIVLRGPAFHSPRNAPPARGRAIHVDALDSEDRVRMEYLMEEFSAPCPIRPADMFDMNLATMISLAGLLLTYVIVFLQFKIGEVDDKSSVATDGNFMGFVNSTNQSHAV